MIRELAMMYVVQLIALGQTGENGAPAPFHVGVEHKQENEGKMLLHLVEAGPAQDYPQSQGLVTPNAVQLIAFGAYGHSGHLAPQIVEEAPKRDKDRLLCPLSAAVASVRVLNLKIKVAIRSAVQETAVGESGRNGPHVRKHVRKGLRQDQELLISHLIVVGRNAQEKETRRGKTYNSSGKRSYQETS